VEEAFFQFEGFHSGETEFFEVLGDFALVVVKHVQLVVDGFHDAFVEDEGVHEDDVAVSVHEAVEGVDLPFYELFHDVICVRLGFEEPVQVGVVLDFVGVGGADAVVGLGADGIAGLLDEGFSFFRGCNDSPPGDRDAGAPEDFLHFGLEFDIGHILGFEAEDIEVRAELGVLLKPVFVVGLDPVDFTILIGKKAAGFEHLVVVFHVVDFVVFCHGFFELWVQLVVRLRTDAQDVDPLFFQADREIFKIRWEIGRNKYKIHGHHLAD